MARRLFGTNGVRGVVNQDMTPELAIRLGRATGTWLKPGVRVAIGTDARTSSPMLASAVAVGLQATGVHVVDLGIAPSPAVQYYVKTHKDVAAGVIITASHNPPQFNGIKLVSGDGTETSMQEEEAVEAHYFDQDFRTVQWQKLGGRTADDGANAAYAQAIKDLVDVAAIRNAKLKVVVDPAGGPAVLVTPGLLKDLGCNVVGINDELDGTFSQRPSEPVEKNLSALIKAVKKERAAFGVAHDGDADRCIFIDDKGRYVGGDESFAIVARYYLERAGGGNFCTPVSSSNLVKEVVEAAGGTFISTAVGSPIVARVMLENDAVFGGEENGGLIFPQMQHCRDGAMSAAAMLEILATGSKRLSQLVDELPEYHTVKEKFDCPDDRKQALMERLTAAYEAESDVTVDTTDGIKLLHPDGAWVLIRPSGTEPIYRVYAESKDEKRARALADQTLERATGLLTKTV